MRRPWKSESVCPHSDSKMRSSKYGDEENGLNSGERRSFSLIAAMFPRRFLAVLRNRKSLLVRWIVVLVGLYIVYDLTFIWQIKNANSLSPVARRSSCPFTEAAYYSFHNKGSQQVGSTNKDRIAIFLFSDGHKWNDTNLADLSVQNKQSYALKHGYDIFMMDPKAIIRSRPAAWSKLKGIAALLPSYDYVWYVDLDTVITNSSIALEWYIHEANAMFRRDKTLLTAGAGSTGTAGSVDSSTTPVAPDVIMTNDWHGPNTGVFFIRNSAWSLRFLDTWFDLEQFDRSLYPRQYPFNYEQRGLHYLLSTREWASHRLAGHPAARAHRAHFQFVPQCAMNSYIVHPLQRGGSLRRNGYYRTDLLVHLAGIGDAHKQRLMRHYLAAAAAGGEPPPTAAAAAAAAAGPVPYVGAAGGGGGGGGAPGRRG